MEGLQGKTRLPPGSRSGALVVVVTGASSGIGLVTAQTLLRYGAKVVACDISPQPEALPTSDSLAFFQGNIAEPETPDKIAAKALESFGRIDGLLNVAGILDTFSSVDTLTDSMWDRVIAVNLTGPVKLMRAVVPHMIKTGGGSIVNVASKSGTSGTVAGVAYTASKHGIVGATKNVAYRFRGEGIRCNATCPGGKYYVATGNAGLLTDSLTGVKTGIIKSVNTANMDQVAGALMKP